jgi:mevalonate kinase
VKHVTVKIPGKVMLAGEYSVLNGGSALATTVDRYMTVEVIEKPAVRGMTLRSELWDEDKTLPKDPDEKQSEPLMGAAAFAMNRYNISGLDLEVISDLDVSFGIGSSSALRLGVLTAISAIKDPAGVYSWNKAEDAWSIQRRSQSKSSGYDIATQLCGGIINFTPTDHSLDQSTEVLSDLADSDLTDYVQVFVGGKGAPTKSIMLDTLGWLKSNDSSEQLESLNNKLINEFLNVLDGEEHAEVSTLIGATADHRGFFENSPHFPETLLEKLKSLPGFDKTFSFKTTGAGGEDAILIVGKPDGRKEAFSTLAASGWLPLDAEFTQSGMEICWHGEELN